LGLRLVEGLKEGVFSGLKVLNGNFIEKTIKFGGALINFYLEVCRLCD
jgi:hypothetical protein